MPRVIENSEGARTTPSADGQNGRAVEDIDWDSLTVRGTCQEVEKRYLRLTSGPDPHTVEETHFLLSKH